jgi:hypothetical protein
MKWLFRILVWLALLCVMYAVNYVYFARIEFKSQPSVIFLFGFNLVFALAIYMTVRRTSYVGGIVGLVLVCLSINISIASEARWQRKKFLFYNYVIDFSYDKYCNLSIEDKFIMEEISIYGITDCDDAKIPYMKIIEKTKLVN